MSNVLLIQLATIAKGLFQHLIPLMHSNNLFEIQPDHVLVALQAVYLMLLTLQYLPAKPALVLPLGPFHYAVYVVVVTTICFKAIPTAKTNRT